MLTLEIPGTGALNLAHLVLDVNGTLTEGGELLPGVEERLARLRASWSLHLLTADTFGRQDQVDARLGLRATRLASTEDQTKAKAAFVRKLGSQQVAAIGNGANDALMLREAALGIAVLGPEGLAGAALREADIVTPNICDALDLLVHPLRIVGTLRR